MHLSYSPNIQSSFNPTTTTLSSSSSSSNLNKYLSFPLIITKRKPPPSSSSSKECIFVCNSIERERVVFQSDQYPIVAKKYEPNTCSKELAIPEESKMCMFYMKRCIEVAKKGMGYTCPDPMVGCVIVKDNVIVGEGFNTKEKTHLDIAGGGGGGGAEVMALKEAGDLARGATAYINLDIYHHHSSSSSSSSSSSARTELILAGVKDVNVGMKDLDDLIGHDYQFCRKLNEAYIHQKRSGKPFLTLRCSVSLNGRILDHLGEGAKECGGYYSQLLQEYDGVILSNASLLKEEQKQKKKKKKEKKNSSSSSSSSTFPTSKEPGAKQPVQIIVTRTPSHPNPRYSPHVETVAIIKSSGQDEEEQVVVLALDSIFRSDFRETVVSKNLRTIIDHCARQGLSSVLIDVYRSSVDFQELLEEGLELGLFQKVVMEILPIWDSSSIRDESSSSLHKLVKDMVEKRGLQLPRSEPFRITKDNVVVVEGYFEDNLPKHVTFFHKISPIMTN